MTEKFESLLKERDITPTKQRLEIADLIFSKNQHFTAAALIEKVRLANLPISQATIYNTLCLFFVFCNNNKHVKHGCTNPIRSAVLTGSPPSDSPLLKKITYYYNMD